MIDVEGLHKSYGDVEAVKGIDLHVDRGEIFALLGPNGAGKTTTVEILEGFRTATAGRAQVLGHDPGRHEQALTERIGIVLQSTGVDPYLSVQETVELYSGYYPNPRPAGEVIDLVGLGSKARHPGAQALGRPAAPPRRRDRARRRPRAPVPGRADDRVRSQRPPCRVGHRQEPHRTRQDRVPHDALHGRGAVPRRSVGRAGPRGDRGRGHAGDDRGPRSDAGQDPVPRRRRRSADLPSLGQERDADGTWTIRAEDPTRPLHELTGWAIERGVAFDALEVTRPSLEDVYLEITGGEVVADE